MPPKDGGFLLPSVVDPAQRRCVVFQIPDEQNHRLAFWGALSVLEHWYSWQRDTNKTGRDIANVWRDVIQLAKQSECAMMDCQEILDCIDTPAGQALILSIFNSTTNNQNTTITTTTTNFNTSIPVLAANCDASAFAASRQFVNFISDLASDLFEVFAASPTSAGVKIVDVVSRFGALDEGFFDTVSGIVDFVLTQLSTSFDTADTVVLRDEFACEVFCGRADTCSMKISDFTSYVSSKVDAGFPAIDSLDNFIAWANLVKDFLIGQTNETIYYTGIYMILGFVKVADSLFFDLAGISFIDNVSSKLLYYLTGFSNDTDNDYQTVCACVDEWCAAFDFSGTTDTWSIANNTNGITPFGIVTATGIRYNDARSPVSSGGYYRGVRMFKDFTSANIVRVEIDFDYEFGGTNQGDNMFLLGSSDGTLVAIMRPTDQSHTVVWTGDKQLTRLAWNIHSSHYFPTNLGYSGNVLVKAIRITGRGLNPFGREGC